MGTIRHPSKKDMTMRRSARPFTVEVKRARRAPHRLSPEDQTVPDDLPSRDIHADFDEQPRDPRDAFAEAEALFRGGKPFQRDPEDDLPIHSTDIFPPLRQPEPEPVEAVAPQEEERKPRILQAVTSSYSDPVQELLQAEAARRAAPRRRIRPEISATPRKLKQAFEVAPEPVQADEPVQATQTPVYTPGLPTGPLPPLKLRPRHKEPRILYNAWNYRLFKREARYVPKEVAQVILTPGNRWKRRLPVSEW